jgi:uncharacterized membrane protein
VPALLTFFAVVLAVDVSTVSFCIYNSTRQYIPLYLKQALFHERGRAEKNIWIVQIVLWKCI